MRSDAPFLDRFLSGGRKQVTHERGSLPNLVPSGRQSAPSGVYLPPLGASLGLCWGTGYASHWGRAGGVILWRLRAHPADAVDVAHCWPGVSAAVAVAGQVADTNSSTDPAQVTHGGAGSDQHDSG